MKKSNDITKSVGNMLASVALNAAKCASSKFSFIYYQDEIPGKVKELNRKNK